MLPVSDLYKELFKSEHSIEWKANINGIDYLSDSLVSARTSLDVFESSSGLTVGGCISAQLDLSLLVPSIKIPKMAEIKMYLRLTDGERYSEWIPKGVFYISTREMDTEGDGIDVLDIHAYDAMLKTEQAACSEGDQGQWPKTDIKAIEYVASKIGVEVDSRTYELINRGYSVDYPGYGEDGYSLRELAGYVASLYAGNCIITDEGKFRVIAINQMPDETYLLCDEYGEVLIFGDDAILIGSEEEDD